MTWPTFSDSTTDPTPPKHAGLGKADRVIYCTAISAGLIRPTRLWWNQICGTPPDWINEIHDPQRANWIRATYCKRPDIMIEQAGVLITVEIKPYASYVALGQAILYQRLAQRKTEPQRIIRSMILTDLADPDLASTIEPSDPILVQIGERIADRPCRPT